MTQYTVLRGGSCCHETMIQSERESSGKGTRKNYRATTAIKTNHNYHPNVSLRLVKGDLDLPLSGQGYGTHSQTVFLRTLRLPPLSF